MARLLAVRRRIREGPLYTAAGDRVRVEKAGGKKAVVQFDPFESVETYSQRYKKRIPRLPRLSEVQYCKSEMSVLGFHPCQHTNS